MLATGQDEGPKAGLVDDGDFLRATKGVGNDDTLFIIVQTRGGKSGTELACSARQAGRKR
jgi:hypothetical protein